MRGRALTAGLVALTGAPSALAAAPPPPPVAIARLQGFFAMRGVVTQAVGVPGEYRGERVSRIWGFEPPASCRTGPCPTIELVRKRSEGIDRLVLRRRGPGFYSGTGTFAAPVRCRNRLYPRGELVPFTITVRVTAAAVVGAGTVATRVRAAYRNTGRVGLTQCFTAPSHDSASYVGSPVAAGAIRIVASTRSRPAS